MAEKLGRKIMPSGHTRDDFECFGPPATQDGDFESCMIADLGCFKQDGTDSNKFYHAAVVKSRKTGDWYTYFEWGRTGQSADFLFTLCYDKNEAQQVMAKQLHAKNDKRGEWATIAGIRTLRAKAGKDCYLVRPAARRTTGLPDAQKIIHDDADQSKKTTPKKTAKKKSAAKAPKLKWDAKTLELGRALTGATIDYTRKSFAGDYVPTQKAIDEGRDVLAEALKRVKAVGDSTDAQVNDRDLKELTGVLYSRIPKVKRVGAPEHEWILSQDNIFGWQQDLDAFEAALLALDTGSSDDSVTVSDPFGGFDLEMKWMDPATIEGKFIRSWMPEASANKHYGVGNMKIRNMWALRQSKLISAFSRKVDKIAKEKSSRRERARFQPKERTDLSSADSKRYKDANVALLFHGTRSVNVSGILRTGLKLPRQLVGVAITGAMFGPGIYWADDWRKSDGYTSRPGTYWASGSGGVKGRGAFMFVANVALGTPYVANTWGGYTKAPRGCHCVAGLAGKSGVQNNEWIVYETDQQALCYLVEYDTSRG